ncbi:MAG: hypothetical protein LH647_03760 [Leptolyngbyaceae cyanobacterium CAN_BIN12]|nr:hypothetical protein [Leptolyngbyaceae cyanobacterium CAN_BIN12]
MFVAIAQIRLHGRLQPEKWVLGGRYAPPREHRSRVAWSMPFFIELSMNCHPQSWHYK